MANEMMWAIENSQGDFVYDNSDPGVKIEFHKYETAINWLMGNYEMLRPSSYRIVAKVD